ncbi:MAG: helicase [Myxococcaceae bacterium]|nr:helicase [Myxococcaceae bacterium]
MLRGRYSRSGAWRPSNGGCLSIAPSAFSSRRCPATCAVRRARASEPLPSVARAHVPRGVCRGPLLRGGLEQGERYTLPPPVPCGLPQTAHHFALRQAETPRSPLQPRGARAPPRAGASLRGRPRQHLRRRTRSLATAHCRSSTEVPMAVACARTIDGGSSRGRIERRGRNCLGLVAWRLLELVGVLFVDEAGQMSLANLLAVAQAATSIVLIGDPQQLKQPLKGSHPDGVRRFGPADSPQRTPCLLAERRRAVSGLSARLFATFRSSRHRP